MKSKYKTFVEYDKDSRSLQDRATVPRRSVWTRNTTKNICRYYLPLRTKLRAFISLRLSLVTVMTTTTVQSSVSRLITLSLMIFIITHVSSRMLGRRWAVPTRVGEGVVPNELGRWLYGRGGWCDGQEVTPWVVDITETDQV